MENIRHIGRSYGSCKTSNTKSNYFYQSNSEELIPMQRPPSTKIISQRNRDAESSVRATACIEKDTRVSITTKACNFSSKTQTCLIDNENPQICKEWRRRASLSSDLDAITTYNQPLPGTSTLEIEGLIRDRNGHIFSQVLLTHN